MRAGSHTPGQYVVYGAHSPRTVSNGTHKTHLDQVLLVERESGHGRGESEAPRDEGHVREHVDEAAPRSAIQDGEKGRHRMAR